MEVRKRQIKRKGEEMNIDQEIEKYERMYDRLPATKYLSRRIIGRKLDLLYQERSKGKDITERFLPEFFAGLRPLPPRQFTQDKPIPIIEGRGLPPKDIAYLDIPSQQVSSTKNRLGLTQANPVLADNIEFKARFSI